MNTDLLDAGGDHQNVGTDFLCQQRRGEIFINHCIHALVIPLIATHHRDATTTRTNHYKPLLGQRFDRLCFNNTFWFRGSHNPAVATPRILNKAPAWIDPKQLIALRCIKKRPDRLGRVSKTGIVFVDLHLRDHRDRLLLAASCQTVVQRLLDQIADAPLRICDAVCQRGKRQPFTLVRDFRTSEIQPHLRPVTVCQHNVVVRCQHLQHRIRHRLHRFSLVLNRLAGVIFDNAVAANGNDHKFFHSVIFRLQAIQVVFVGSCSGAVTASRLSRTCLRTNMPLIIR